MKLIVGLGNPGEKYAKVRHNLGFMVLDELVKKLDVGSGKIDKEVGDWKSEDKFKSEILKLVQDDGGGVQDDKEVWLAKPITFMNNSGMAVSSLINYFKIPPEDLIIIHDDLDLMLGKIKVRIGGAAGGHHGVESIIDTLGTDQFIRVRLGIGNLRSHSGEHKRTHFNAEHFVLESFMPNERSKVKHMIKQAVEAVELILNKGLDVAQNQYN